MNGEPASLKDVLNHPSLQRALAAADTLAAEAVELGITIAEIPAPTFQEGPRAAYVRARFESLPLPTRVDDTGNVVALREGTTEEPGILLAAHLDTVFAGVQDVRVERDGDVLRAPGIGDNSIAVACLLALAQGLDAAGVRTRRPLYLAATVGEEGLGNLRGIEALCRAYADRLAAVVAVEGHDLGVIGHVAVGSRRWEAVLRGPGGHSWEDRGRPSAIHALGRAISRLADLAGEIPREHASLNVGLVQGGTGINVIADTAHMKVDIRATDAHVLASLDGQSRSLVEQAAAYDSRDGQKVTVEFRELGHRPAGSLPVDHPLVATCLDIHAHLGLEGRLAAMSTDMNIPLSLGIPAVTVGLTTGGHIHRLTEYIYIPPIARGLKQLLLLVACLAHLD